MDHPVELKHTVMVEHPVAIEEEEECEEGEERRGLRDFQAVTSHEPALLRMRNLSDTSSQGIRRAWNNGTWRLELSTNFREDFSILEYAPTGAFSWLSGQL